MSCGARSPRSARSARRCTSAPRAPCPSCRSPTTSTTSWCATSRSAISRAGRPGGEVRCTLPLAGTFQEFHDLYREVLVKHDKHDALDRLDLHLARYPTSDHVERCLAAAGLSGGVQVEECSLLVRSSREFCVAPVSEYGPLPDWKTVAGGGQDMQDVFWYIKEAIDAYFGARPFQVTVRAGLAVGKKPPRPALRPPASRDAIEVGGAIEVGDASDTSD